MNIFLYVLFRLSVLVISSQRSGTGKSLVVEDFVEQLDKLRNNREMTDLLGGESVAKYIIVPLLGKTVNLSDTVGFLLPYSLKSDVPVSRIFHFDVSPSVRSLSLSSSFKMIFKNVINVIS